MTTDERIDRLTERHEALTQSVEMLTLDVRALTTDVGTLKGIAETTLDSIKRLERIAMSHETRITNIEGDEA